MPMLRLPVCLYVYNTMRLEDASLNNPFALHTISFNLQRVPDLDGDRVALQQSHGPFDASTVHDAHKTRYMYVLCTYLYT